MPSIPSRNPRTWARVAAVAAVGAVLLCLGAGALSSCRDPYSRPRYRGAGATTPRRGGTFQYGIDADLRSLDPHIAYDSVSGAAVHLMFETLVQYAPTSTEIVPALATRWEVSPDGHEYTFFVRQGVHFHSGRLMTADDVRRSFERMLDPRRVPGPGTSFYRLIEGFDDFQEHRTPHLAGLTVLDPYTVRFRLTQADQTFLHVIAMSFASVIDVDAADRLGLEGFMLHPVGTGPYMLERWEQGSRLVFARNPRYWRPGRPYLDRVVLEINLARNLQFMRFQRGDLEYLHNTSFITADYVWLRGNPAWQPYIDVSPEITTDGITMNTEMPPLNNVHLRRAIAFAIDRDALCRARNYRLQPLGGLYPPGLPGYDPHLPGAQRYDVAEARREMALAGYANGLPDEIEFWVQEGDTVGQLLQADLARIGVRIRLRQVSFSLFLESHGRRGTVPMAIAAWAQDFPDPSNFAEILFHSRSIQPEGSQNYAFYSNHALDALLDQARVEPNAAARIAMYQRAEQMIVADAPWAFIDNRTSTEVVQPYVRNFHTHPVWSYAVGDTWLDLPRQRIAARERTTRGAWGALTALALPWSFR